MSEAIWYFMDRRNQRQGPMNKLDLVAAYRRAEITPENLVWHDGMPQWLSLRQVQDELGLSASESMPATPPPLPPIIPLTANAPVASPSIASQQYRGIDRDDIVYAGFVRRLAALFVDGLILIVPLFAISFLLGIVIGIVFKDADSKTLQTIGACTGFLAAVVIKLVYFAFQESSRHQATFGKRALGIKVTDESGQRLSFGRAVGRYFASALSYLTLYVGFLMAGFTERKRALHDMVASTLVVDKWAYTEFPERQQRSVSGCLIAIVVAFALVIPVGAILAAIAIPAYQDYVIRSQVSEGPALAEGSKTAVAEYYSNKGNFPSDNASAGVAEPASITGNYVSSLTITNGTITVAYDGPKANSALNGKVLAFGPIAVDGSIHWECTPAAGTTIDAKYLPVVCR